MRPGSKPLSATSSPRCAVPSLRLLVILLATIVILLLYFTPLTALHPTRRQPADLCFIIGVNPRARDLWQFSARSLCLSSSVCLNAHNPSATLYHASDLSATTCKVLNPDLSPSTATFPALVNSTRRTCPQFQHDIVHCAHGPGLFRFLPACPSVRALPSDVSDAARWHEDLSILVPDYPYPRNIYHFAGPVADLVRTIEQLSALLRHWGLHNVRAAVGSSYFRSADVPIKKINIVFQGAKEIPLAHRWKRELLVLMLQQRVERKGIKLALHYLGDATNRTGLVCLRNAVVMGRRGHKNVWPFPNVTDVSLDGLSVPVDAVNFKKAAYDALSIKARLPTLSDARSGRATSELPPFTVAYAKRDGKPGADGYYRSGDMRKFLDDDEAWFSEMLRNETNAVGARLIIFSASGSQSLQTQVETIKNAGFVVGIHGANLVNALFMHPFGVLMEIMPKFVTERCYVAGANSGLKYLRYESSEQVSVVDSGCYPKDYMCISDPRQRTVNLSAKQDREGVRKMMKEGIGHLQQLRKLFPSGVPVRYNEECVCYEVNQPEHTSSSNALT